MMNETQILLLLHIIRYILLL